MPNQREVNELVGVPAPQAEQAANYRVAKQLFPRDTLRSFIDNRMRYQEQETAHSAALDNEANKTRDRTITMHVQSGPSL